jgi:hypothetical protein
LANLGQVSIASLELVNLKERAVMDPEACELEYYVDNAASDDFFTTDSTPGENTIRKSYTLNELA